MRPCSYVLLVCLLPSAAFSQGFSGAMGLKEAKTVGIKRLFPATVNLNQKRITVEAISAVRTRDELVMILKTKLVTMIQGDPRFIVDEKNPQTILKFTVTNSYIEESRYTVGTGASAQQCHGFGGKVEVSYQALDAANRAPLDSENLVAAIVSQNNKTPSFKELLHMGGSGGPCSAAGRSSMHEAQDYLVNGIVRQMGQRAAPTDEIITVKLPGKKLEPLSRLALAQRWGTLEEEAEKAEKLPKPEDDAYRVYLLALAKEAQAYDIARESAQRDEGKRTDISSEQSDKDFQKAQSLLDGARKLYKDAIQAKPNEKEFQEPDNRMEQAISVYAKIARHKEEYQKFLATQTSKTPSSRSGPATDSKAVDIGKNQNRPTATTPLDQVVKFCQAGMDLGSITDYVKDASFLEDAKVSSYAFNFRTDALILNANCKEKASTIQRLMRDRLSGPRRAATGSTSRQ